jgi:hypothetical protein
MISVSGYPDTMPRPRKRAGIPEKPRRRGPQRDHPNRIHILVKEANTDYAEVGEKVGSHETTIARLASGKAKLTVAWMERLAPVLGVPPADIKWPPATRGMRPVRVRGAIEAGSWAENHEWEPSRQYDVMIPDEPAMRRINLYAGQVQGESMNLRYPPGTVVIFSNVRQGGPDQIKAGRRYHVRRTRADGLTEDTVKLLFKDDLGRLWLKPESSHPEHQAFLPLEGTDGETIEIIGRVRFAVQKEPD